MTRLTLAAVLLLGLASCRSTPEGPEELERWDAETGERCGGWNGTACGALLVAACNVAGERCELRRTDGRLFACEAGCDCEAAARRALTECE